MVSGMAVGMEAAWALLLGEVLAPSSDMGLVGSWAMGLGALLGRAWVETKASLTGQV